MPEKLLRDPIRLRVLMSGCLPPPIGGMAAFYESLLSSSLPGQVDLCFVQTSKQKRALSRSGRATISNLILAIRDCRRFLRAVLSHRSQICHIGTAFGLSFIKHSVCVGIAHFVGIRVLLHPHCSLSALYCERSKWWRWLFRRMILMTDGIVALSKEWIQLHSIIPACRVYYLPNAINLSQYLDIAKGRVSQVRGDGPLRILYLGYLGKAKGSFDLIDAAKYVQSKGLGVLFDLVGDELTLGEWDQLNNRIGEAKLNGNVRLHPAAFGSEKLRFFRNADIFVYPSYHEGMPIAVIEAMACGLPIVATKVGGLPDLVADNVNGVLVEPGRPDQLASALHKLAMDNDLCHSMQSKSHQFALEQYDMEQRVTQLIDIYKAALSER